MAHFHTQAVLRRTSPTAPLLLVGVTLDNTFYPRSKAEATGRLSLTKGLVALAPLDPVEAGGAADAAAIAIDDARATWNGPNSPGLARNTAQ